LKPEKNIFTPIYETLPDIRPLNVLNGHKLYKDSAKTKPPTKVEMAISMQSIN